MTMCVISFLMIRRTPRSTHTNPRFPYTTLFRSLCIDSSEYAVRRYGRSRNLKLARFGQLDSLRFGPSVDLLVCSDVLHYLPSAELKRGLSGFAELCHGVAFIEAFCRCDEIGRASCRERVCQYV